jgi:hypothetical protein
MRESATAVTNRPAPQIDTFENEVRRVAATSPLIRHGGLFLTIGYAFLTIVGLVYSYIFYKLFGINVLEYSETSDFIAAAVREPVAVLLCVAPGVVLWLFVLLRRAARRLSPRYDAYALRHETRYGTAYRRFFMVSLPLLLVIYALTFSSIYAQASAERLRHGKGTMVRVLRTTAVPSDSARKVLVGTTAKFFFFYDTLLRTTDVVPVGNVAAVTIDLPAAATPRTK